ncbi:uncharacterized protein LOC126750539 [Anthonomus grandis grandis]|uniref:uncharacterized protein LOC126750539 n=1 Tax=Anthonomus grandis grandis TaxID=2921223 RepID=UPI002164F9CE|nr:uncharacterized protein LOC126750539 [Anthonomus grandis grandis]
MDKSLFDPESVNDYSEMSQISQGTPVLADSADPDEPEETLQQYTVEELLITCVEARPPLWNSRLSLKERSKTIRDRLWLEIFQEFAENPEFSLDFLKKNGEI